MATKRHPVRKPFSEMSRAEKIAECKASIARLEHPHNRYSPNCQNAARMWRDILATLETITR